jgi:hypothetical protein
VLPQQTLAQRLTLDERHDVVERVARFAGVVERQDVRVDETAGDRDLAQEPPRAERSCHIGAEHLDRDLTIVLVVVGQVDRRPAASAQLALDGIPARESRL